MLGDRTEKATTMGTEMPPLRTQQNFIIVFFPNFDTNQSTLEYFTCHANQDGEYTQMLNETLSIRPIGKNKQALVDASLKISHLLYHQSITFSSILQLTTTRCGQ